MRSEQLKLLQERLIAPDRKPLVIRGARQVGKTWLVREFAQQRTGRLQCELMLIILALLQLMLG